MSDNETYNSIETGRGEFARSVLGAGAGLVLASCASDLESEAEGMPEDSLLDTEVGEPSALDKGRGGRAPLAVVIGTGFGAAPAILRMALAGIRVDVYERGQEWPIRSTGNSFPTDGIGDRRSSWFSATTSLVHQPPAPTGAPYAGLLELVRGDNIDVSVPAAVGGGSIVCGGATVQPTKELFRRVIPREVDYASMDAVYFPRVRSMLKATPVPGDLLAQEPWRSVRVFDAHARQAGFAPQHIESPYDWDVVRAEMRGEATPSVLASYYTYGTNSGAKVGLERTYLRAALETGLLRIMPLHIVRRIRTQGGRCERGYEISAERIDPEGAVLEQRTILADYLFVCAGSVGTTRLLVAAREEGDLPHLNEHVGQQWAGNGDVLVGRQTQVATGAVQAGPPALLIQDHSNPLGPVNVMQAPAPFPVAENVMLLHICMGIPEQLGSFVYDPSSRAVQLKYPKDAEDHRCGP